MARDSRRKPCSPRVIVYWCGSLAVCCSIVRLPEGGCWPCAPRRPKPLLRQRLGVFCCCWASASSAVAHRWDGYPRLWRQRSCCRGWLCAAAAVGDVCVDTLIRGAHESQPETGLGRDGRECRLCSCEEGSETHAKAPVHPRQLWSDPGGSPAVDRFRMYGPALQVAVSEERFLCS